MQLPMVLPASLQKKHKTTPKLGLKPASNYATIICYFLIKVLSHLPQVVYPSQSCAVYLDRNLRGKLPLFNLHCMLK